MFNTPNHQPIIPIIPKTPTKKGHENLNVIKPVYDVNYDVNSSASRKLFFETPTIRELIEPSINSNVVGINENVDDCASSS